MYPSRGLCPTFVTQNFTSSMDPLPIMLVFQVIGTDLKGSTADYAIVLSEKSYIASIVLTTPARKLTKTTLTPNIQ